MAASVGCQSGDSNHGEPIPAWLTAKITQIKNERAPNVPAAVTRALYRNKTVYYTSPVVPDGFGSLYDEHGVLLGHPDGGIDGRGDGRCSDYFESASEITTLWKIDL